eukprot:m.132232 g.132232  ORF g.132232 m.132232 type:complete len:67 (-) comp17491_c0_seq10:863-1063(-)
MCIELHTNNIGRSQGVTVLQAGGWSAYTCHFGRKRLRNVSCNGAFGKVLGRSESSTAEFAQSCRLK